MKASYTTRMRRRESKKMAEAIVFLHELHKDDPPPEKSWLFDFFVCPILKFCCFLCGVKWNER